LKFPFLLVAFLLFLVFFILAACVALRCVALRSGRISGFRNLSTFYLLSRGNEIKVFIGWVRVGSLGSFIFYFSVAWCTLGKGGQRRVQRGMIDMELIRLPLLYIPEPTRGLLALLWFAFAEW
jgi:hypothetical protein